MREQGRKPTAAGELSGTLIWFVGLVGRITWEAAHPDDDQPDDEPPDGLTYDLLVDLAAETLGDVPRVPPPGRPLLWSINRNRPARPALYRSRNTIKADAATLLFDLRCNDICWAVLDSGIDATHPAFTVRGADGRPTGTSRVRATYDFTKLRAILAGIGRRQGHARRARRQAAQGDRGAAARRAPRRLGAARRPAEGRRSGDGDADRTSTARTSRASSAPTGWRPTPSPRASTTCAASARTSTSTTCASSTTPASATSSRSSPRCSSCAG